MQRKKIVAYIILIILFILLDSIQALVFDNNPVLKIRENYNGGNLYYIDKGILVDTYYCSNGKKDTVIKGFSYSCSKIDNFTIIDTSKIIKDFTCAEALEEIYEDDDFTYYLSCIKSKYIEVRYPNGKKENIKEALLKKNVSINDLDKFDISYLKYNKGFNE